MNLVSTGRRWRRMAAALALATSAAAPTLTTTPAAASGGLALAPVGTPSFPGSGAGVDTTSLERASRAFGRLPLRFEPNRGQADPAADFVARGAGYALALTSEGAVLALRPVAGGGARVAVEILGARPVAAQALDELPGRSHYFVGDDPSEWLQDVPGYGRVRFPAVLPGVDVVWHGRQRHLEYDFVVAPHADPSAIRLRFPGAGTLQLRGHHLVLRTSGGELVQPRPVAYQEGPTGRRPVRADYALDGDVVSFRLGAYDRRLPLVIDPVLTYSTYLGGAADDFAEEVALDAAGNAYVTGETGSPDFPLQSPFDGSLTSTLDAFVTKLSPTGTLVYSTYLGGSGTDHGRSIAVDAAGSAYVTGTTRSTNFPLQSAQQPSRGDAGGFVDAFVTKLAANGAALVFSTYLGGNDDDVPFGIALDGSNRPVVGGYTESTNFPTQSALQGMHGGGTRDAFVTKYEAAGTTLVYSTHLGGSGADRVRDVGADAVGNAYLTGDTESANFPTQSPRQPNLGGTRDAFVTKVSAAGALVWSTYHGGAGLEEGLGIDVDGAGSAYVTGLTTSSSASFPLQSALDGSLGGTTDAFLSKLAADGASLVYSTYLGGSAIDNGRAVALDACGRAFVVGETESTDFPITLAVQGSFGSGTRDAFITAVTPTGAAISFSTYLGGTSFESAGGVDAGSCLTSLVLTGQTQSTNFPRANAVDNTFGGPGEAFVTKIDVSTDAEPDGIPDLVEPEESRNPLVKDNEVFTNARLFAMQQYRDFLGREGDPGGIAYWTGQINAGETRASVVENFFLSAEFQSLTAPVTRLYFAFFLRIPDYPGLTYWIDELRRGVPLSVIAQSFVLSTEFQTTYGALNDSSFVELVYQNVLGRDPDPAGRAFWEGQLAAGLTRGEMMASFSESDEFKALIFNEVYVVQIYVGMLQRAPDQSGFDFWLAQLDGGASGRNLIQSFLDAAEYHDRFLP